MDENHGIFSISSARERANSVATMEVRLAKWVVRTIEALNKPFRTNSASFHSALHQHFVPEQKNMFVFDLNEYM